VADDLSDLPDLERLQDIALPPLAPPELVRARGAQRRARSRALLLGSVLSVMALGFGTTVALSGGGEQATLSPAAPVSSTASPSAPVTPSPKATPAPPSASPRPSPSQAPSPSASASASASAVASAPAGSAFIPAEALLAPADLGISWVRTASSRGPVDLALDPCKTGVPDGASVVAHLSGVYSMQDADGPVPESAYFTQQVMRYPSAIAAQAAAEAVRESVAQCPTTQDEGGSSRTWLGVGTTPFLVQVDYSQAGDDVDAPWYDYAGVTVAGDLVSTWILGDPHGMSRPFADKTATDVVAALCKTAGDC